MKRFIMIMAIAAVMMPGVVFGDTITLVADEWCPYNCALNSQLSGYFIEIAKAVFGELGHSVNYQIMDWDTAIKEARAGKYNAIVGAIKEDAPDFIFPENEFGVSESHFFVNKADTWKFTGIESLNGKKIGIIQGYAYGEILDNYFKNNKLAIASQGKDALDKNLEKLLSKQIDVIAEDQNVFMLKVMSLHILPQIKDAGFSGKKDNLYIAFSPAHPQSKTYAKALSEGIAQMRKTGKLAAILEKYGLKDWR